jgi:C4-dicarboxylate-specific signal transduction histidine kinase
MNQLESGEAPGAAHGRSDSQKELAEVLRQRAAISEVLRAIASSPHDLQPIFDTILDSARRLSRADTGAFRLVEEAGFRLVAQVNPDGLEVNSPLKLVGRGSFYDRLIASKSPFQIPDVAAHELYRAGEALAVALIKRGQRTLLVVPMLRNDELIGSLAFSRLRVEPFTEKEIELVTDFAAQATIVLEIVRRERQYRQLQMELAHANRVATIGQLTASIVHELKQPIAAARTHGSAGLRWLDKTPPNLAEVGRALARIMKDTDRAGDVIDRIGALIRKAPPRNEVLDLNEAIVEVTALTHSEALKTGVTVRTQLAPSLPRIHGDRVQLQQVMLNLIVNAIQAMSDVAGGQHDLLITTEATEDGARVGVQDTGPGLPSESLPRLFEPFYTTKSDGMGIGLSICRSIIEAHGGRLWATGNAPQGAFFQFTIPARPA